MKQVEARSVTAGTLEKVVRDFTRGLERPANRKSQPVSDGMKGPKLNQPGPLQIPAGIRQAFEHGLAAGTADCGCGCGGHDHDHNCRESAGQTGHCGGCAHGR